MTWLFGKRGPQPRPSDGGGIEFKKETPEVQSLRTEIENAYTAARNKRDHSKYHDPFKWTSTDGKSYSIKEIFNAGSRPVGATPGRDGYIIESEGDERKSEVTLRMSNGGLVYKESHDDNPVPWRELSLEGATSILQEASSYLTKLVDET